MTTIELSIMIAVPACLLLLCIFLAVTLIKLKIHKKTKATKKSHMAVESQSRLNGHVNTEYLDDYGQSQLKDKRPREKPRPLYSDSLKNDECEKLLDDMIAILENVELLQNIDPQKKLHTLYDEPLTDKAYILLLEQKIVKLIKDNVEARNKLTSTGEKLGLAIETQQEVQQAIQERFSVRYTAVKIKHLNVTVMFKFTGVAEDMRIEIPDLLRAINSQSNELTEHQNRSIKRGEVKYCEAMNQEDFQKQLEHCKVQLLGTLNLPKQLPKDKILVFSVNKLPNGEYNFRSEHSMSLAELLLTLKEQQQMKQSQSQEERLAKRRKFLLSNWLSAQQLKQNRTYLTPQDLLHNGQPVTTKKKDQVISVAGRQDSTTRIHNNGSKQHDNNGSKQHDNNGSKQHDDGVSLSQKMCASPA